MKFVMIIMFATLGDMYVFTDPSFDTRDECMTYLINNGQSIQEKLVEEYGFRKEVKAVNCMQHQKFLEIINGQIET